MEMMEGDCKVTIILLGESDVGKTSLILRFVENKFRDSPSRTTVDKYEKVIEIENNLVKLILWDTAGRKMYNNLVKNYYNVADGVLLIYDIQDFNTFSELSHWLNDFRAVNQNAQILLVGNKSDDHNRSSINVVDVENFVRSEKIDCIEVSSKLNKNVNILFYHIVKKVLVAKGILPYSEDSQPAELKKSEDYISSTSISEMPQKVINTSNSVNISSRRESLENCIEPIEQNISSTRRFCWNSDETAEQSISNKSTITGFSYNCEESIEQNTSTTSNTSVAINSSNSNKESVENRISSTMKTSIVMESSTDYVEPSKQSTFCKIKATNSTEPLTGSAVSSTIESSVGSLGTNEQGTGVELTTACEESIDQYSNTLESLPNVITNNIHKANGISETEDEDPAGKDYMNSSNSVGHTNFQYSRYSSHQCSGQDTDSIDSAESAEEFFESERGNCSHSSLLTDYGFVLITEDDLRDIPSENAEQFFKKKRKQRFFFRSKKK